MTMVLRLLHIICGVLWVGGAGVMVMFILPAVGATGPAGGQFMQHVVTKTKLTVYLPILGVITVLAGFGLYYHDMSISGGGFGSSRSGMVYGIGGALALVALILGGAMTGSAAGGIQKITNAVAASGGPPTAEQTQQLIALRGRMALGARIAFLLVLITTICMAVARYL